MPRTIAAGVQVNDAPDAHVDDAQEALVLLLELLLVKDLNCEYAVFGDAPGEWLAVGVGGQGGDVHVEALVPVGVQRLLDHARGARLFAADGGNGEGVREAWGHVSSWRRGGGSGTHGRHHACRGRLQR